MTNHDIELAQAMKSSGVKWIDDIPVQWTVKRLKEISKFESGWTPESKIQEYYTGDIPWATIGDLPNEKIISETKNKISLSAVNKFNMRAIPAGTLLFSFKLSIGQVAFTACEMFTNEAIAAFRQLTINKDFAYYALPFFVTQNCKHNIYGAPLLNRELMLNSFIPIPPACEQQAIAEFLNRETSIIDQKIAIVSRKQGLLAELRKAIIHEAVTKGLRGTIKAPVQNIELHNGFANDWSMQRLKDVATFNSGDTISAADIHEKSPEYPYPVFGGNGVRGYHAHKNSAGVTPLIGRQGALCGNINLADGEFWATEHAVRVKAKCPNTSVRWLAYVLDGMNLNQYATQSAQPGLSVEKIKPLLIMVPPSSEQEAIAAHLDEELARNTVLANLLARQEELFKEQRKALIHEVVTGKMRVI